MTTLTAPRLLDHRADFPGLITGSGEPWHYLDSAATAQKPKAVSVGGKSTVFASGRIKTWNVPLTLQPGENTIQLTSPAKNPLFVRDLRWTP